MARILVLLLLVFPWMPQESYAADTADRLKELEITLKDKEQAAKDAADAAAGARRDLGSLQQKLRAQAAQESALQERFDDLSAEWDELHKDSAAARARLDKSAKAESGALGLMVRLAARPPAAWWLHDGPTLDQERRMILLRGAVRGLESRAAGLKQDLREAGRSQARLMTKQDELAKAKTALQDKQAELNGLIAARRDLAATHQAEHAALLRETQKLTAEAADLHGLLDRMSRRNKPKAQNAAIRAQPGLTLPATGRLTQGYGVRDRFGVSSRGVTLAAKPGSRIVAPLAGKVVFAGLFKGYGDILILQHTGDYHSLLAGFGRIDVTLGQTVLAGEPVGIVAGRDGDDMADVYFELRRDGDPVDPLLAKLPGAKSSPRVK